MESLPFGIGTVCATEIADLRAGEDETPEDAGERRSSVCREPGERERRATFL